MFGLNYFLLFLPYPEMSIGAELFLRALNNTGYMFIMIKCIEITVAILFLLNRFVPLAIVLIAPGIVNIVLFHLILDHRGLPMAGLLAGCWVILVAYHRDAFAPLLKP
jgi:hypothetical protein